MASNKYKVLFEENGDEYTGYLIVDCEKISRDENSDRVFYADNVRIEIDERIISIMQLGVDVTRDYV